MEAYTPWSVILVDLISRLGFCSHFLLPPWALVSWFVGVILISTSFCLKLAQVHRIRSPITALGLLLAFVGKLLLGPTWFQHRPPIFGLFSSRLVYIAPSIY